MEENDNFNLIKKEQETQTMPKLLKQKSLFTKFENNESQNKDKKDDTEKKDKGNLENNDSLLNILTNKSHFIEAKDFTTIPLISTKRKTFSFIGNMNFFPVKPKKVIFKRKNQFYLTASVNPINEKRELKKCNSTYNLSKYSKNNLIDLIHEKEIQLCLDLIKSLPDTNKKNIKNKNRGNIKEFKAAERENLIKLIKTFNIDNIHTQRIIEDQVLNNSYYNMDFNPLNTVSMSMSTNYKTNNPPLNNIYKFNSSNFSNNKNFNSSSITLRNNNNSSIIKNNNDSNILNNNSTLGPNANFNKTKVKLKSINNKLNNKLMHNIIYKKIYDPRNEINFHTGFVRSQKNIYIDVYSKYLNNKRNEIRIKNYRKKKQEANKLSLPEIEEYKSLIKEIENRRKRQLRKSQSVLNLNKDKNDYWLKDHLIEELNNLYNEQKSIFLHGLRDNFGDSEKKQILSHKEEINSNIRRINKIKREPNSFVDGYSLFDGKINKKLKQYNQILGNKFHDRDVKEDKAEKFNEVYDEYENKIKNYQNELFNKQKVYKKIFIPKIDFKKDKDKDLTNEFKIDMKNYNVYKLNGSIVLGSNKIFKVKNTTKSTEDNAKKEKIYNDYINFRNEYKNGYCFN